MANNGSLETLDILLQKRMQRTAPETGSKDFLVFGHYDVMSLQLGRGWHSFRPGLHIRSGVGGDSGGLFELYPIRLAFPKGSLPSGVMRSNCKYWRKLVRENQPGQGFISLIMMNLSESVVYQIQDPQTLYRQICRKVEDTLAAISRSCLEETRCCVFYSIGYCDFAVLIDTQRLDVAACLIDGLSAPLPDSGLPFSTSCVFYGIHTKRCAENNLAKDDRARFFMQFSLHPGVTPEMFFSAFRAKIIDNGQLKQLFPLEEEQRQAIACLEQIKCGEMSCAGETILSGSYNAFLRFNLPPRLVVRLFQEGAPLNPFSKFREDYIHAAVTSIVMPLEYTRLATDAMDFRFQRVHTRTLFYSAAFLKEFNDFRNKMKRPTRPGMALAQLFKRYENLLANTHAFDIGHILDDVFLSLMFNIRQTEMLVQALGEDDRLERIYLLDQLDASINIFREKAGDYLSDLALSDKAFAEEYVLIHPSIGSATKLLIAYNQMVNSLVDALGDDLHKDAAFLPDEGLRELCPKHQHNFLVISGGCDETAAYDVFGQLDGVTMPDGQYRDVRLVVLQFPEMTLFDIGGTLFHALHEAYHFSGDRLRKQRKAAIDQAVACFLAEHYSEIFMKTIGLERWIDQLWLPQEGRDRLKKVYQHELLPLRQKELKDALQKLLLDAVGQYIDIRLEECRAGFRRRNMSEELLYYSRYLYEEYEDALCFLLANSFTPFNNFFQKGAVSREALAGENEKLFLGIYELVQEATSSVYKSVLQYCRQHGIDPGSISHAEVTVAYSGEKGCFRDMPAYELLWSANEWLVGGNLQPSDFTFGGPLKRNALDFLQDFGIACRESYSDIMALATLEMEWYEFFAALAYECWDMDKLLPQNIQNVLRIGADLKVYYGISDKLSMAQRKELDMHWKTRRDEDVKFAAEIDAAQLADRIDAILEDYAYYCSIGVGGPLEEYLHKCRGRLKEVEEAQGRADSVFAFLRKLNREAKDNRQKSLMALLGRWSTLAERPDEETGRTDGGEGV